MVQASEEDETGEGGKEGEGVEVGVSDNESKSRDPTGQPLLLTDGTPPLPDPRRVLSGPGAVGPDTSTRDIVIRLAQLGEICSNESPCADGLICGSPDDEGTRRCQAEESSDSSDAIVIQQPPEGQETKGQSIETQVSELVNRNEELNADIEAANADQNDDRRLFRLFGIGISYLPAMFLELNLNTPIELFAGENFSSFTAITILAHSSAITQELIDYINNLIDLIYTIPEQEAGFAHVWRQMVAANNWPQDFTPFDFMLTLGRYATRPPFPDDVIQISEDGLRSSVACDGFVFVTMAEDERIKVHTVLLDTSNYTIDNSDQVWTNMYNNRDDRLSIVASNDDMYNNREVTRILVGNESSFDGIQLDNDDNIRSSIHMRLQRREQAAYANLQDVQPGPPGQPVDPALLQDVQPGPPGQPVDPALLPDVQPGPPGQPVDPALLPDVQPGPRGTVDIPVAPVLVPSMPIAPDTPLPNPNPNANVDETGGIDPNSLPIAPNNQLPIPNANVGETGGIDPNSLPIAPNNQLPIPRGDSGPTGQSPPSGPTAGTGGTGPSGQSPPSGPTGGTGATGSSGQSPPIPPRRLPLVQPSGGIGQQTPGSGQNQPGSGQNQPGSGQQTPGSGQNQPGSGQNQPGSGQQTLEVQDQHKRDLVQDKINQVQDSDLEVKVLLILILILLEDNKEPKEQEVKVLQILILLEDHKDKILHQDKIHHPEEIHQLVQQDQQVQLGLTIHFYIHNLSLLLLGKFILVCINLDYVLWPTQEWELLNG